MKSQGSVRERARYWWLAPKPFDLVSSTLYIAVVFTFFLYDNCQCDLITLQSWRTTAFILCIAILLFIDRWEYWRYGEDPPLKAAFLLLLIRILLIEAVAELDRFNFSPFLYLIPPFLACLYFGNRAGYILAALAWAVYLFKLLLHSPGLPLHGIPLNNLIIFTLGLIFAITMARIVVNERTSRKRSEHVLIELEDSHQQLKTYTIQIDELATTRERNRMARDIHDTLGHYLTVINIQLEKALAFREKKPNEADQAVSDAKRLSSEALQEVRSSVGILRASNAVFSFSTAMDTLVKRIHNEQLSINLHIKGDTDGFSTQSLMTLYRATQEGLTNVQKHASAQHVYVQLQFDEKEATLTLSDNGQGFDYEHDLLLERGYGLQGMQERLELVGGSLEITSKRGQGTRLFITIPQKIVGTQSPDHPDLIESKVR